MYTKEYQDKLDKIEAWLSEKGLKRRTEIEVFEAGIKPAVLVDRDNKEEYTRVWEIINKSKNIHSRNVFRNRAVILSWKPIPPKICAGEELGITLGFYPESCYTFNDEDNWSTLDFNGIFFCVGSYKNEAIQWCKEQYGEKLLEKYGGYYYIVENSEGIVDKQTVLI